MASRKTAGAAAKKQTESEPTQAVTANEPEDAQTEPEDAQTEPVQETPVEEPDKEKEPAAAPASSAKDEPAGRYETFEATRPDKVLVRITRNLDTGEQRVDEL
ncbi:hypothetical protein [Bifidobacterium apicola]|uniref:hypothetical protein n=1 Tax=Bifidobacterium apicola TaxID=3230739 RepID=UPI0036F1C46A